MPPPDKKPKDKPKDKGVEKNPRGGFDEPPDDANPGPGAPFDAMGEDPLATEGGLVPEDAGGLAGTQMGGGAPGMPTTPGGGMGGTGGMPTEPYGAQFLRLIHKDHMALIQEYHDLLGPLEHEGVRQLAVQILNNIDQDLSTLEAVFAQEYGQNAAVAPLEDGLPPMPGAGMGAGAPMGEGAPMEGGLPEEGLEGEPLVAEDEIGGDLEGGDDESGIEEAEEPLEADSGEPEEPTTEEAFEGTKKRGKKALSVNAGNSMGATVPPPAVGGKCGHCGKSGYGCGASPDSGHDVTANIPKIPAHYHRKLKEALGYLQEIQGKDVSFGTRYRQMAFHHHMSLKDAITEMSEGTEMSENMSHAPQLDPAGHAPHLETLAKAAGYFQTLSGERAFGLRHGEQAKIHAEALARVLEELAHGGPDAVSEMHEAEGDGHVQHPDAKAAKPKVVRSNELKDIDDEDMKALVEERGKQMEEIAKQLETLNGVFH